MLFIIRNQKQFTADSQGRYLLTQEDLADLFNFTIESSPTSPEAVPGWFRFEIDQSDLAAIAATSYSMPLMTLPTGTVVHAVKIKHSEAFAGGSISGLTAEVGITGDTNKFASGHDCMAAVSDAAQTVDATVSFESHSSAVIELLATFAATGANLSALTSGNLEIWVLLSRAHSP